MPTESDPNFHELKIWPAWFDAVRSGLKKWEIRKNDRGFKEGDILVLKEWNPDTDEYTGSSTLVQVDKVWENLPSLDKELVILDIRRVRLEVA